MLPGDASPLLPSSPLTFPSSPTVAPATAFPSSPAVAPATERRSRSRGRSENGDGSSGSSWCWPPAAAWQEEAWRTTTTGGWLEACAKISRPVSPGLGAEALRRDLLAFGDRHEDSLADLVFHLDDGQVVLAHTAFVEARLAVVLSASEPVSRRDPGLLDDRRSREAPETVQQLRLRAVSRKTLEHLLRWAYGEAVPEAAGAVQASVDSRLSLDEAFALLEACDAYDVERLGALLRESMLEALSVEHFAAVLRESHTRNFLGLKQGCLRFALHRFDELVERPELFVTPLQEHPDVVSDLFRLGRQWKDDEIPDQRRCKRTGSPRPGPAPPGTFVSDLERLFQAARHAEDRGKSSDADDRGGMDGEGTRGEAREDAVRHDLAPDCRIAVGGDIYWGHAALLSARSDFFLAAFTSDMAERQTLLVSLQHVQGDTPQRESVLALLHFLYTGKTERVTSENAMQVLALVGGEGDPHEDSTVEATGSDCCGLSDSTCNSGGFLQLHDASSLRKACEATVIANVGDDEESFLPLLAQAHALGATRLRAHAMALAVHHFKPLALGGALAQLPPDLLTDLLRQVALEYDQQLPSPARGVRWELALSPAPECGLENTYEAVSSADLSCGAGAAGAAGCSEALVVATFGQLVRVRRIKVGVDLTVGDFDAQRLNGGRLQYLTASGSWHETGTSICVEEGLVREIELPQAVVAKAFRIVRKQRLAVGLLAFE